MKALDTNVLVRFLINDDKFQAARVRSIFEQAEQEGQVFFVAVPVVLELLWVLAAVYERPREAILNAVEQLTMLPILRFEDSDRLRRFVVQGRAANADLADILIGLSGAALGCDATLTFDQKAARSPLFELLLQAES
jgi:predicted nucleic-acid-binding protein